MTARAALLFVTSLAAGSASAGADPARELLPDLDQDPPSSVAIRAVGPADGRRYRLVFRSAVANVGDGPLVIEGRRASRARRRMRADQLVMHADGSARRLRDVGFLRYVVSADHQHWHLLDFERYELRSARSYARLRRDRKTGFCLGDRYAVGPASGFPVFVGRCGLDRPGLRAIVEGITPGFGDDYPPQLEGQFLDVTRLPAGRYVLVHHANPGRTLAESDYANNAASILLELTWPRGHRQPPEITELAACPDTARCDE